MHLLAHTWPAKAADRSIAVFFFACFIGLLLTKFIVSDSLSVLSTPLYVLIFSSIGWVVFQRPYWGIVVIVALLPVEKLLPHVSFATSMYPILGGCVFAGYVYHEITLRRKTPVVSWTHVFGFMFLLWICVSNPLAAFSTGTRTWFWTFFQLFTFMFLTTQLVRSPKQQRILLSAFIASAVVSALFTIPQVRLGLDSASSIRATGLAGGPNGTARLYIIAIFSLNFLAITAFRRWARYVSLVGIVILFAGLAATVSRTGLLLLFVLTAFVLLYPGFNIRKIKIEFAATLLITALVIIPTEYWRITSGMLSSIAGGTDSVGFRYMQWDAGLQIWKDHFLAGVGIGQFRFQIPFYGAEYLPFYGIGYVSHNLLLSLLVETGIVGALLFMLMTCSLLFFQAGSLFAASEKKRQRSFFWLAVAFLVLLGGSSADTQFEKPLWFVLGVGGFSISPSVSTAYVRAVIVKWRILTTRLLQPSLNKSL